jgi:hypothetical protein
MPRPTLTQPVTRLILQSRLDISDRQWPELERLLTRFDGPHGVSVYDWPSVVNTIRRLSHVRLPVAKSEPLPRLRRRATAEQASP